MRQSFEQYIHLVSRNFDKTLKYIYTYVPFMSVLLIILKSTYYKNFHKRSFYYPT